MRIITGKYGGRLIKMPKSKLVRPTTDKTKESIFNYLNNLIDFNSLKVCDMYAGSGSLGLEALSRGASEVHFIEKNFQVYKNLLENIKLLNAENSAKIFKMTCTKFSATTKNQYDLILADPPFFHDDIHQVVENIKLNGLLNDGGILIIERSVQTEEKDVQHFGTIPFKKLGDSLIYKFIFS